ncbi:MAG: hypothetical protein ABIR29_03245 [Chthoniobacterales bacterium]
MKTSLTLLLGAVLCTSGCVVAPPVRPYSGGATIAVAVGDRPYYNRGPYYVQYGRHYAWVPGHWARHHGRRVWVHGHYAPR